MRRKQRRAFEVKSGASSDLLTVGAASHAARGTSYTSAGSEHVYDASGGLYSLPVFLETTIITLNPPVLLWAMRNGSTKTIYVAEVNLQFISTGNPSIGDFVYELVRFSGANPTGGTAITPVKHASAMSASTVQDARFEPNGGLSETGITYDSLGMTAGGVQPNIESGNVLILRASAFDRRGVFELAANEGLGIRNQSTLRSNAVAYGTVRWREH